MSEHHAHEGSDEAWPRLPDPRMIRIRQVVLPEPTPTTVPVPLPPDDTDDETLAPEAAMVRPFIVTGGRTEPGGERLRPETLITATAAAMRAPLSFERRQIVRISQLPLSIAEVANNLGVPIGVARVLVDDLLAEQFVTVHEHLGPSDCSSRSLLERIREGVRAL